MDAIASALLVGAVFGGLAFVIGQLNLRIRKAIAARQKRQHLARRKLPELPLTSGVLVTTLDSKAVIP